MRNITVSVDDETYRRARVRAAELDTSVSAVVRRLLAEFAEGRSDFERRKDLQNQVLRRLDAEGRGLRASERLTRDEVHDRSALR